MKNLKLNEPRAEKIEKTLSIHGEDRVDEYYWLNKEEIKRF